MPFLGVLSGEADWFVASGVTPGPLATWSRNARGKIQHEGDALFPLGMPPGTHKVLASASEKTAVGMWNNESNQWEMWRTLPGPAHAAAFFHRERAAALVIGGGEVGQLDLQSTSYEVLFRAPNPLNLVAVSDDDAFVAASGEGETYLWSKAARRVVARFVLLTDGRWLVVDPEGRFDSNQLRDEPPAYWRFEDASFDLLSPETFMQDFFQPNLAKRISLQAAMGPVPTISRADRDQPVVGSVTLKPGPGGASTTVTTEVRRPESLAVGRSFGVDRVQLLVDGSLRDEVSEPITLMAGESETHRLSRCSTTDKTNGDIGDYLGCRIQHIRRAQSSQPGATRDGFRAFR